jgi:hypothetical protein
MANQRRALFMTDDRVRHRNGGGGRVVAVRTVYVYDVVWDESMIPRKGTYDERDLAADPPSRTSRTTNLRASGR